MSELSSMLYRLTLVALIPPFIVLMVEAWGGLAAMGFGWMWTAMLAHEYRKATDHDDEQPRVHDGT